MTPLVIIHGWSDSPASFQTLAALLAAKRGVPVPVISLGRYISMNDHVTYDDLAAAMDRAWTDHGLPREPGSVDAVVHSTGGLVIRDWLVRHATPDSAPVKHLVMLAPANFGSPLAHKGRSFVGRVIKGFTNDQGMFQTGTQVLKGLELASPYSWKLAERDRFGEWSAGYGRGRVLATVLVGNRGYDGIRAIANEDGGDGTVRVSTANMNCARLEADFSVDPKAPTFKIEASGGAVGFGVVDGYNHGTITLKGSTLRSEGDKRVFELINRALDVRDAEFRAWCDELDDMTAKVMAARAGQSETHGFQNTVVRVIDHEVNPVPDYLVEFFEEEDAKDKFAKAFHTKMLENVHAYADDASYRSLYIDCTLLMKATIKQALRVGLTAHPVIEGPEEVGGEPVGYRLFRDEDAGSIRIPKARIADVFRENRTLLATIKIRRERAPEVFRFEPATG